MQRQAAFEDPNEISLGPVIGRSARVLGTIAALGSLAILTLVALLAIGVAVGNSEQRAQTRMAEIARTLATQVDGERHEALRHDAQTNSPEYRQVAEPLADVHAVLEGVSNVYTLRVVPEGLVYVLDTAYFDPVRSRATVVVRIGEPVPADIMDEEMARSVQGGTVYVDRTSYMEGGVELRGVYAPIRAADWRVAAILGIDFEERHYRSLSWQGVVPLLAVGVGALVVASGLLGLVVYLLRDQLGVLLDARRMESVRDGLTGLYNRRFFTRRLERHVELARRGGFPLSLLVLDADHFKRINDTWGHPAGDRVLVMIAEKLQQSTRADDLACRIGGEEFAVIMPDTDIDEAQAAFRRISVGIREPLSIDGTEISVTVSGGIAALDAGTAGADALLSRSDQALYVAKESGRDWCVVAPAATGSL